MARWLVARFPGGEMTGYPIIDPRRRSTLQYVVFVPDEKNYIEYFTCIETQRVYL